MGTACQEPGAARRRRLGGTGKLPKGPEQVGEGSEFAQAPQFPALHSGRPLAGALPLIWEVARAPGFRQKPGRGREGRRDCAHPAAPCVHSAWLDVL